MGQRKVLQLVNFMAKLHFILRSVVKKKKQFKINLPRSADVQSIHE